MFPRNKRAAVLVLLFELNRDGHLRVLLTTRSKSLRSHPGQTALPGGKVDPSDKDVVATAVSLEFDSLTNLVLKSFFSFERRMKKSHYLYQHIQIPKIRI